MNLYLWHFIEVPDLENLTVRYVVFYENPGSGKSTFRYVLFYESPGMWANLRLGL